MAEGAHRHLAEDGREGVLEGRKGRLAAAGRPAEDARGADPLAVRRRQPNLVRLRVRVRLGNLVGLGLGLGEWLGLGLGQA